MSLPSLDQLVRKKPNSLWLLSVVFLSRWGSFCPNMGTRDRYECRTHRNELPWSNQVEPITT